jgi:predicted ATPase
MQRAAPPTFTPLSCQSTRCPGVSLARLLRDQGRSADAWALLQPVYDRFTEGFDTADLRAAKALIDGLYDTKGHNAAAVVASAP